MDKIIIFSLSLTTHDYIVLLAILRKIMTLELMLINNTNHINMNIAVRLRYQYTDFSKKGVVPPKFVPNHLNELLQLLKTAHTQFQ